MNTAAIFFALLRAEVCGGEMTEELKRALSPEQLESVFSLAKEHDLAHIAGQTLGKNKLLPKCQVSDQFRRQTMLALMRSSWLDNAYENICQTLEEANVPFIPLKGAVLRGYYPESWMRTSCDIDILVKEEMLETAAKALEEKQNFTRGKKSQHDISLHSPGGVHLELHHAMVEENRAANSSAVLDRIWEDARPREDGSCHYVMSDAMFYFYHIAHMAKHVQEGGCGVRPFLDLWILNHRVSSDPKRRQALLKEGGLWTFAKVAESLAEAWFSGKEGDKLTARLGSFILHGGMYGSVENDVAIKQTRRGGKLGYALSRIFPPYKKMIFRYPVLERHPWLLPVYHVVRWITILRKGNGMRSLRELETNIAMPEDIARRTVELLKKLDL